MPKQSQTGLRLCHFKIAQGCAYFISALEGKGLDELMERLIELAPEGPAWYPKEYYTDQEPFSVSLKSSGKRFCVH
jgi:GTPase Era involved in 16S rRNA processing